MSEKRVVLITGCSDGGLGSALALAFHATGKYRVIATARNIGKLSATRAAGIEELQLDVLSEASISACVKQLEVLTAGRLDVLVNNAGAGYNMPVLDADINQARKLFELNVWSLITVGRAFVPLLLKGKDAQIVNNISAVAYTAIPVQGIYNASKAAANMLTETLRLELKAFGIRVIALITGTVRSNFHDTKTSEEHSVLPEDSIYRVVPKGLSMMQGHAATLVETGMPAEIWARDVVGDLSKSNPPHQIWRGKDAWMARYGSLLPTGTLDGVLIRMTKLDELDHALKVDA